MSTSSDPKPLAVGDRVGYTDAGTLWITTVVSISEDGKTLTVQDVRQGEHELALSDAVGVVDPT